MFRTVAVQLLKHMALKLVVVLPTVLGTLAVIAIVDISLLIAGKILHTMLVASAYLENKDTLANPEQMVSKKSRVSPQGLKTLGWVGAIVALLVAVALGVTFVESLKIDREIAITAHRGSSLKAPENTLSAIRQAVEDGADYAEIDVQTTSDGVVVLLHDADLMRVASVNRKIHEMSYDEIKVIDIGSWFGPEFAGERTATLKEAIELANYRIKLNIELKYNRTDPDLAKKVGEIVQNKEFAASSVVSSLNYQELQKIKSLYPELKVGLIVFRALGDLSRTKADFLSINASKATATLVKEAHRDGKEVHVWTVNDISNGLAMIELGVDNIITDDPKLLKNLLRAWKDLSDSEKIALMLRNLFIEEKQLTTAQL
jgi:glycerophosphoryl diester phosphodiesterase